mgnify:CR=1 FL=1
MNGSGSVIVGEAYNDHNELSAYRWSESTGMVGLGTLASDNRGSSTAYAVSEDGLIIVGAAQTDEDDIHATLWKIKGSETEPNIVKPLIQAMQCHARQSEGLKFWIFIKVV